MLAAVSLALPATLTFDPWAWLVWGREVGHLDLDTTGSPSWKPLPVLVTTLLAPLGVSAAPLGWLLVSRAVSLLGIVAAYRLARRFAGVVGGCLAAGFVLLTPDPDPRFVRLVAEGHAAPLTVTFSLFAFEMHFAGHPRRALALAWCAALVRPEAWPLLGAYALWLWWRDPSTRRYVLAALVSIPVLWFGGDWWGSGDAWHGADVARVDASAPAAERTLDALGVVGSMVPLPVWGLAALGVASAYRRGEGRIMVLAVGALAWTGVVVGMALTLGYAALGRFLLPAAAALCVLAGTGAVRSLAWGRRSRPVWVAGLVVSAALLVPRIAGLGDVVERVADRGDLEADLDVVLDRVGDPEALSACDGLAVTATGLLRPSVAWKLGFPLHEVRRVQADHRGALLLRIGTPIEEATASRADAVVSARSDDWVVYTVDCAGGQD